METLWPSRTCKCGGCQDVKMSGFKTWPGHYVRFLGKTGYFHNASLDPGV